jgi:hypothetical protein
MKKDFEKKVVVGWKLLHWNSSMEVGGMFSSVFSTSVCCFQLAVYFFSCRW